MDSITLYQPPGRPWGLPNLSPFCGKLETYLRMAEVPHTIAVGDMRKAPKGKIPYVAIDGGLMGDSQLIIERCEAQLGDRALDAGMTARDRATARAVRRMLDEGFYFVGMYRRWVSDDGFRVLAPAFKQVLPAPVRMLMPLIRRSVRKSLRKQGTGRHAPDEIEAIGIADLEAVATLLGDQPFLFGDQPRTVDASGFAFVDGVLRFPVESRLRTYVQGQPNLVAYCDRIRARWFGDLATDPPAAT
jgi:glutathione S-transferase